MLHNIVMLIVEYHDYATINTMQQSRTAASIKEPYHAAELIKVAVMEAHSSKKIIPVHFCALYHEWSHILP